MDQLRQDYERIGLSETDLAPDPFDQFREWYDVARESSPGRWFESNAMTLATAGPDGQVSARIVLLKHFDQDGFVFFTDYESAKGRQLDRNPQAALVLFWPYLARQIRIEGTVAKTDTAISEAYFSSRPHGSRISAATSRQSRPVASREVLEQASRELADQCEGNDVPRPDRWGGYRLTPTSVEFWQGRTSRLHDRLRYRLVTGHWIVERISP